MLACYLDLVYQKFLIFFTKADQKKTVLENGGYGVLLEPLVMSRKTRFVLNSNETCLYMIETCVSYCAIEL